MPNGEVGGGGGGVTGGGVVTGGVVVVVVPAFGSGLRGEITHPARNNVTTTIESHLEFRSISSVLLVRAVEGRTVPGDVLGIGLIPAHMMA